MIDVKEIADVLSEAKTGAISYISERAKDILAQAYYDITGENMNRNCGRCIIAACDCVNKELSKYGNNGTQAVKDYYQENFVQNKRANPRRRTGKGAHQG